MYTKKHKRTLVMYTKKTHWWTQEFSCVFWVDVRVLLCFFGVHMSSPVFFPKRQKNTRELLVFWSAQTRFFEVLCFSRLFGPQNTPKTPREFWSVVFCDYLDSSVHTNAVGLKCCLSLDCLVHTTLHQPSKNSGVLCFVIILIFRST